jgi:capsular exopolysaccharide synthesis family protein
MQESQKFPALPPAPSEGLSVPGYYVAAPPQQQVADDQQPTVPLTHYIWLLRRQAWKIAAFVVTCMLATLVVSERLPRIYESIVTVDVDRSAPTEIMGQGSERSSGADDADLFLATQVKIIQSDAVVRPVAERYNLLEHENAFAGLTPQEIQRKRQAPMALSQLTVKRPPSTYLLLISYRSPDPQLAADVANAVANSYLAHTYNIRIRSSASMSSFMEKQLDELKAKMELSAQALSQFEKQMNVINPDEKTSILSARLLQLNTEYTTAEADRVRKEAAYNSMKSGSLEAAQVSSQGESLGAVTQRLNEAKEHFAEIKTTFGANHPEYRKAASQLAEVQEQFDDMRRNIAARVEVDYKQALNREQMLRQEVTATKAEYDNLNSRSFEYQQLKREAETDKTLYDELVKKIHEADINAGFQNNNIRIADMARPTQHPVFPRVELNLLVAFLLSGLLAVGGAVLADSMDTSVRDPEETSRYLGTDVIGVLPAVQKSEQLIKAPTTEAGAMVLSAAAAAPATTNGDGINPATDYRKSYYRTISGFGEAIRTLRNTIALADIHSRLRSIVVTSASPAEGKTTVAVHLAVASAMQGTKTLLVDGDLRRPSVHGKFGLSPEVGFNEVLTGKAEWRDVIIQPEGRPNLSLLPAGRTSHRAADLVGPRMAELLDEFANEFDLVIFDSPPLLGFAETLQMATAADGVLVIARAGETRRKAVASVLGVLKRIQANVIGVVLNQVKRDTTAEGYYYYGYYYRTGYYYNYRNREAD